MNAYLIPPPPTGEGQASKALLSAALDLFAQRGYHATTTRDIATAASLSAAALYVHFESKEQLLFRLSQLGHEAALRTCEAALARETTPKQRFAALIRAFAGWHAEHNDLARVAQYEIGALNEEHRGQIAELRRSTEALFRASIEDAASIEALEESSISLTTLALMSLCIDVSRWYREGGRHTPASIGETYSTLALRIVTNAGPDSGGFQ